MLKRNITYEDFNGVTHTEPFYFNFTKAELVELEVEYEGGLQAMLQRVIEATDQKALIHEFKKIVLLAYGEKSDDGKQFVKSEAMREKFSQHAAYSVLFMELATNDGAAAEFANGVIPKDLAEAATKASMTVPDQPTGPPKPPQVTS